MASLGHIAVGMAAARVDRPDAWSWRPMVGWAALAMLPDADVIGFSFGVRYADAWGHRGATHSLAIALIGAAAVTAIAPALKWPRWRTWWIALAVLASHGLLDTLTDGGLGCALLWPFDRTRYFAPWRPIPVAPIGLAFLSPYGFFVAIAELALFAPLIAFALGYRPVNAKFLTAWALSVWLIASTDPVRERVIGITLREDTEYAPNFSEQAFRSIAINQLIADVRQRVGEPLGQGWMYFGPDDDPRPGPVPPCPAVYVEAGRVATDPHLDRRMIAMCERSGVRVGMTAADVVATIGEPVGMCWRYTRSPSSSYYRGRAVCFEGGKVIDVMRAWVR